MGVASVLVNNDEVFMLRALELAQQARDRQEVPVGAVIVINDEIVGEGFNQPIAGHDASAHAEIVAIRAAGQRMGNYRLVDATLYVTIEPCMMCVGAMLHSRIKKLVIGAREPKAGAVISHELLNKNWQNHTIEVVEGILADQCGRLMSSFFKSKREQQVKPI